MAAIFESVNSTILTDSATEDLNSTQAFRSVSAISYLYAVITLYFIYICAHKIREWYRLSHIPGPFTASFCREWLIRKTWGGNVWIDLGRLAEKYGMCQTGALNEKIDNCRTRRADRTK